MAGIKFELQKDVFEASKERLHCVVAVNKTSRKSKKTPSYLCLTGTIERPIRFNIYLIKKTDKGSKKKQEWTISALKKADYKSKESLEFDLLLEKTYQWSAVNLEEKDSFFLILLQVCSKMNRPPTILNFKSTEEIEQDTATIPIVSVARDSHIDESDDQEYGLTEREEFDLEKVMSRAQGAIVNAHEFMEQLSKELSLLDGENINSIMESESKINSLMDSLDATTLKICVMEKELEEYDEVLSTVKQSVDKIEEEHSQIGTASRNNQQLLDQLKVLVNTLDFPYASQVLDADFSTPDGTEKATKYVEILKDTLEQIDQNLNPELLKMEAVSEQKRLLDKINAKFSHSFKSHLVKLIRHHGNISMGESRSLISSLKFPPMSAMHNQLNNYYNLMKCLKFLDQDSFKSIQRNYTSSVGRTYDANLKALFEEAKARISGSTSFGKQNYTGSTPDLRIRGKYFGKTRSLANRDGDTESQGSGEGSVDSNERQHFYDVLDQILEELESVVNSEERFITSFFHITAQKIASKMSTPNSRSSVMSPSRGGSGDDIMVSMFGSIERELSNFLTQYEKIESSFCMGAMVRLGSHALRPENSSTFIGKVYGSILIQEKRNFDKLMSSYVQAISDSRMPRKAKPGILPFVTDFEDFASMAESIFSDSSRRSDLERWYTRMVFAIFESIYRLSSEGSSKIPGEVISMENFHRLHAILSRLKIQPLEQQKKDAKAKYTESLNAYVTKYFGRPLVKLNEFFEGVQAKVSQGFKESEIGYHRAFNRDELKKIIKDYPAKEVKKGLESLYKKIERHLSEEENLLQVVWRAMQEEFIVQYKSIESLISRCYPESKIALDFTIEDILKFFSEIALSH